MVMPDAIRALLLLEDAPRRRLARLVYNVSSFSLSAGDIYRLTLKAFPAAVVRFVPDVKRQGIVDSWPCDVDDTAARRDWGWHPEYDQARAFDDYLIPAIRERHRAGARETRR
jgi:nucleoside-diphosphate-sugar epimerase